MPRIVTKNRTLAMGLASLETKRRLDLQQIPLPNRPPVDIPPLPQDPTELTDSALMRLFTTITKWSEYLSAQLAMAEVDERYAEAALDKVRLIKGIDLRTKDGRASVKDDTDYWEAHDEYRAKQDYRKVIEMTFTNSERNSTLLSRELTRRVNREAREGRVTRLDA